VRNALARTVLAAGACGLIAFAVAAATPGAGNAGMSLSTSGWSSHLTAGQVRVLSANADQRVIVLLRNQHSGLTGRGSEAQQARAFATDRAPIVQQLQQLHAPRLITYRTVNAVATTVSSAEAANLRRDPAVLAVYPDSVVKGPPSNADLLPGATRTPDSSAGAAGSSQSAVSGSAVCGTASAPLLEPEALRLINADNRTNADSPIASGPRSAHSLGYTGAGVNVAVFPDGMDPKLPDFQRNGQSAVTDYRDFSGEGTSAPTGGGEAFGDVSSLVSQAHQTYNLDQEINPSFATPGGTCDVKVLGVAPGADVDVMKVFGTNNASFTSVIMQGIDWAIQHDHANILSISIGFFGVPTSAALQPLTAILENAIAHGTTVVASTGDSSPSNTESSPALDPGVIGAAASTSYRIWAQTNLFLYDMAGAVHNGGNTPSYHLGQSTPGWLSNEVSTLSSSGVTEDRRMPDVIAPGDLNWADCSTNTSAYTDCENALGGSTIGLEDFGGTSESAPLTAGVAALVIQAYRHAHGGKTPPPAVVRQIIFSSATDIGVAAENQGAGLLNALRAVELAKAYGKHAKDGGLVHSPDSIADLGNVRASRRHTVTVKNTGNSKAKVRPVLRTLGPKRTLARGRLTLFEAGRGTQGSCAGIKTATYFNGETIPELNCKTFHVPKGVDALDSRLGWQPLQTCTGCTAGEPTGPRDPDRPEGSVRAVQRPAGRWIRLRRRADSPARGGNLDVAHLRPGHLELRGGGELPGDCADLPHRPPRNPARLQGRAPRQVGLVHGRGTCPDQAGTLHRRGRLPQQQGAQARDHPGRLRGQGPRHDQEGGPLQRHPHRWQRPAGRVRPAAQLQVHGAEGRPRPGRQHACLPRGVPPARPAGRPQRERRRQPAELPAGGPFRR